MQSDHSPWAVSQYLEMASGYALKYLLQVDCHLCTTFLHSVVISLFIMRLIS